MTFKEFLKEAQKLKGWRKDRSGVRRRVRRGYGRVSECPLTAVANAGKGQREFGIGDFEAAAHFLGIHPMTANAIVLGADSARGKYAKALQALVLPRKEGKG